jgi:hypothetical protein
VFLQNVCWLLAATWHYTPVDRNVQDI